VSDPLSPKILAGRIGGLALHGSHNSDEIAARARRGFYARFLREAEQAAQAKGETLTAFELARRADYLRRAHMARLAMRSAMARRSRRKASDV
jgi:hypothetical protein